MRNKGRCSVLRSLEIVVGRLFVLSVAPPPLPFGNSVAMSMVALEFIMKKLNPIMANVEHAAISVLSSLFGLFRRPFWKPYLPPVQEMVLGLPFLVYPHPPAPSATTKWVSNEGGALIRMAQYLLIAPNVHTRQNLLAIHYARRPSLKCDPGIERGGWGLRRLRQQDWSTGNRGDLMTIC